jgi:enoyl-CoA hydratase/carnithine racemase
LETRTLDHVIYEKDGPIARIILNNPERANAQTSQMVHSVNEALDDAQYDYDIKVVIIKANGKGFCSGHVPDGSYPEFKAELEASGKVVAICRATLPMAGVEAVGIPETRHRTGARLCRSAVAPRGH